MHKFSTRHSTHSVPAVAAAVARAVTARIEVQDPRVVRIELVERRRTVVAVRFVIAGTEVQD